MQGEEVACSPRRLPLPLPPLCRHRLSPRVSPTPLSLPSSLPPSCLFSLRFLLAAFPSPFSPAHTGSLLVFLQLLFRCFYVYDLSVSVLSCSLCCLALSFLFPISLLLLIMVALFSLYAFPSPSSQTHLILSSAMLPSLFFLTNSLTSSLLVSFSLSSFRSPSSPTCRISPHPPRLATGSLLLLRSRFFFPLFPKWKIQALSLYLFSVTPCLQASSWTIVSLGIGVIDQMHRLALLPPIMPIPAHIVWRIPGI